MTKKTRLTILFICVACFLFIAPVLVGYSMGYRFDFEKMKVTATGGIYVRTFPAPEQVFVDSKISEKPGIFSNSVFVQSLIPSMHSVLVKKTGYNDYSKTLPVLEKQVTKIENILLIKKNLQFQLITDATQSPFTNKEKFIIKNSNLYYSDAAENSSLTALQKSTPLLKKIAAFMQQNNNIIWLGTDGLIYKSDISSLASTPTKITTTPIKISKTGSYTIVGDSKNTFLNDNGGLSILNTKTNELENLATTVKGIKVSPDEKNIIYYNDTNIYLAPISTEPIAKTSLYKSSEIINDCLWLNNDYVIFTAGDKIIISEIDFRSNVNSVALPQTIVISPDQKIDIKVPQIFFNQKEGKLYILTNKVLLVSEKITQ